MTDTATLARVDPVEERAPDGIGASAPEPTERVARPRVVSTIARRGAAILAGAVVAFLVFGLWLSGLAHARSQVGLQRRFRAELSSLAAPIGGAIGTGAPVAILRVPSIGVNEVVVEGARSGQLREGPGHVVGTSLPGQPGNAVIAGRRMLYGGPFRHLSSLRRGDRIDVTTGQGGATYRVIGVTHVPAADGSLFGDYGDNRLTLFTSDPAFGASGRLVVAARLVGSPFSIEPLRRTLDAEGLGLTGEQGAMATVLVWLELLLVLSLLSVFATTRWSRWTVWVVFAPTMAVVLWLIFENAVRLLPATL